MQFMDLKLARRVEMAEAFAARACAEAVVRLRPELNVAIETIAGGIAAFTGVGSPITQAIGVGLNGPVTEAELDRLEEFFWSRGARTELELCPLVDLSLYEQFAKRGYVLIEVSNVLIRDLSASDVFRTSEPVLGVTLREAERSEAKLWTQIVAQGFAEHFPVTTEILDVMEGFFYREGAAFLLASVDGKVAGGAVVSAHDGVGGLFGASTLVEFRRRGVQSALLAARLAWARDHGCDVAVSITQPGSASQRNIERYGFRVAYTRAKLARAKP
jgi:GNAT superfamily N-acetyltransferase